MYVLNKLSIQYFNISSINSNYLRMLYNILTTQSEAKEQSKNS